MHPSAVFTHFQAAKAQRILMSFTGVVTQEIMVEYGKIIKEQAQLSQNERLVIFNIFVELTQNILRYSAEKAPLDGKEVGVGIVLVSETDSQFYISSGNLVTAEQAVNLEGLFAELVGLDREGLRQLFKQRRRQEPPPGSKGAGLGLIEVARRACDPLSYALQPMPNGEAFFSICVPISKEQTAVSSVN